LFGAGRTELRPRRARSPKTIASFRLGEREKSGCVFSCAIPFGLIQRWVL
jgi:hypothetical protein